MSQIFVLTSFKKSPEYVKAGWTPFSVAVYQPKGFHYPKLGFFDIRDENGKWNRPRDFLDTDDPLTHYRDALKSLYNGRRAAILDWAVQAPEKTILCCWCPYDRAAQRQLNEYGTFVCHTEVVGIVLRDLGFFVSCDSDRTKMRRLD